MKRIKAALAQLRRVPSMAIRCVWNATENEDRIVFTGLALLGAGIAQINTAAALITVGALLVLLVRPLRKFF